MLYVYELVAIAKYKLIHSGVLCVVETFCVLDVYWKLNLKFMYYIVTSLKKKFAAQMLQCFFCYQVVDPFQASSDFSAPVIPTTPCCLQQACLQFICN